MDSRFSKTNFITGLRGYSALGVFLIHSGGGGLRTLSTFSNKLVDFGKYGVISFFVLSSFTICMSLDSREFSFKNFLVKRFFRIAPLYYLILLLCFFFTNGSIYYNEKFGVKNDLYNLFMHMSFLNVFDVKYINNIIGVEATIPIEMFYYLIIPVVFFYLQKKPSLIFSCFIFSLIISFCSYFIFKNFYNPIDKSYSHAMSVEKYLFSFITGIVTYLIYKKTVFVKQFFDNTTIILLFLLLAMMIYFEIPNQEIFMSLWISCLILVCSSYQLIAKFIFENKLILKIGDISYSLYLIHFPIIGFLSLYFNGLCLFTLSLAMSLILSFILYNTVELPFIRFARKITYNKT